MLLISSSLQLLVALWAMTFYSFVDSSDCNIKPLVLLFYNQSYTDADLNIVAINRGAGVTFPDDHPVALRLTCVWNDTRMRSAKDCDRNNNTYFNSCEGASGSVFWLNSTGFVQIGSKEDGLTDPPPMGTSDVIYGETEVNMSNTNLKIPIQVYSKDFGTGNPYKSFLALGPKSTVLQRLLDGQFIPSKVIGLFYGSRSVDKPTDGKFLA